jgi:glutamate formiminotransferase
MLNLFNSMAQIELAQIDPAEVAKLDDNQQSVLSVLIVAVQDREAATVRFNEAVVGVREADTEQHEAMAAHVAASDPFPFVPHPDIAKISDKAKREGAMLAAREQHDAKVTAHRAAASRRDAIAAYNASH